MKIGKYLCCGYIIILLGIFNKSLCKTSLSACQLKNPFKAQDNYADFTDICFKNDVLNSTNSHCQLVCNQLESTDDLPSDKLNNKSDLLSVILVVITIINIILAFVLLNKFKLTNTIQVTELENETEETESENESVSYEIKSKHIKREVIGKCSTLENQVQKLETEIVKLKKDKMDLIQTIDDQSKKVEVNDVRKNENIENMKRKNLKRKINTNKDKLDNKTSIDDDDGELQKTKNDLKSIKKELELKERIISEKNAQIEMTNIHVDNLSDEINNLNLQQRKSLIDLKSKDSAIEKLRDDIEGKIIEIKKLEQKNEEIVNNLKCLQENSLSILESDSSLSDEPRKVKISVLNEINKLTGNEFDSLNDCIFFINKLSNNTDKEEEIIYNQEENFERFEDTDREKKLEMENEELHDKIYVLERKCEALDKKYKKQLMSKDEDIEELQEELENAKLKKHQDNKNKTQMKALEEKIEELQGDIESRTKQIKCKNDKLKEIEFKSSNFESRVHELETEIDKLKKDKKELTKLININNKNSDEIVKAKEKEIEEKQNALDVVNQIIEEEKFEKDKLTMINAQQIVEINELKSLLEVGEELHGKLNIVLNDQQKMIESYVMKIKSLEDEIHSMHFSAFKSPDNLIGNNNSNNDFEEKNKWYPIWWDNHTRPDHNNHQQTLKNLIACPNCNTMYSHKEIENHVYKCLENED